MGRCAFRQCGIFQELRPVHLVVVYFIYLEHALRQSSCLVKYDTFRLRQCLQIIGSFYKYACIAGASDPSKEA